MKRILLLLALAVATFAAQAQNEFVFGRIKKAELRDGAALGVENADAVVLDERVRIMPSLLDVRSFMADGQACPLIVREEVARRVKILSAEGAEYGKVEIALKNIADDERENCEPHSIWANCYTLKGGRIVKRALDVSTIKRYKRADGSTFLAFEIPEVQQGSVIEYGYTKAVVTTSTDYKYVMSEDVEKLKSRCEVAINEQYAHLFDVAALNNAVSVEKLGEKSLSSLVYGSSAPQAGRMLSGMAMDDANSPALANALHSRTTADTERFTLYIFGAEHLPVAAMAEDAAAVSITVKGGN
ncbi:MAG: hypothetical protein IKY82_06565 [Alistipes sp.]|nr:hypothetical protein [Alistipes sp.]